MKMFLTRIGFGAKAVITGDISQIDLPRNIKSGLKDAREKLRDVEGLYFHTFTSEDVVRHPLVQKNRRRPMKQRKNKLKRKAANNLFKTLKAV